MIVVVGGGDYSARQPEFGGQVVPCLVPPAHTVQFITPPQVVPAGDPLGHPRSLPPLPPHTGTCLPFI